MADSAEKQQPENTASSATHLSADDGLVLGRPSTSSAHPAQTAESLSESPEARLDRETHTASSLSPPMDGSVITTATLSGHQHPPATSSATKPHRTPFYRRKTATATKQPSDKLTIDSTTSKPKSVNTAHSKQSLLSRVVNKVVPCVNSSPRAHPVELGNMDVDATTPRASSSFPKDTPATATTTDSKGTTENTNTSPDPASSSSSGTDAAAAGRATPPAPLTITPSALFSASSPTTPVPSPTDSEIIIPPPPSSHLLPEDETDGVTSGAVVPPGSTGLVDPNGPRAHPTSATTDSSSDSYNGTDVEMETDDDGEDDRHTLDEQADEERLIRRGGNGITVGPNGELKPLLPPIRPEHVGRKCLVLDLDETLVHSSFKPTPQTADFVVPVEIEYHWHHFHVLKRPGVDEFMRRMGEVYEVVVFTASLSKYADPVLDILDIHHVVAHRLFRESCYSHKGNYVKDLSQLGRPIADTIILDNSPASYVFHPTNAVPVSSWFNDPHDAELTDLIPFLVDLASVGDVRQILDGAI